MALNTKNCDKAAQRIREHFQEQMKRWEEIRLKEIRRIIAQINSTEPVKFDGIISKLIK